MTEERQDSPQGSKADLESPGGLIMKRVFLKIPMTICAGAGCLLFFNVFTGVLGLFLRTMTSRTVGGAFWATVMGLFLAGVLAFFLINAADILARRLNGLDAKIEQPEGEQSSK